MIRSPFVTVTDGLSAGRSARQAWWVGVTAITLLGLVSVCAAQEQRPATLTYRLMAWNVGSAANIPFGPRQVGQIADTIIDEAAHIVGLTEVELGTSWHQGRDLASEIAVALAERGHPMHSYKWPAFQLQGGWATPVLFSGWPIEEEGHDTVPPAAGYPWAVGHITVNVAEKTPVRAYMTHFWPQGEAKACRAAIERLARLPEAFAGPRTIMGDFNLTPDGPWYSVVREAAWQNSLEVVHGRPLPTVQGTAGVSGPLPLTAQIDYIFGNDEVEFLDSYVGYFSMSDHWPVIAEVRVKRDGPAIPRGKTFAGREQTKSQQLRAAAAEAYRRHEYAEAARRYETWEHGGASGDEAGFAAYSAACMRLLGGDVAAAVTAFERVVQQYPDTEWAVRARQRLGFIHKEAGRREAAAEAFIAYALGYYAVIHPDPKAPAARLVAGELAALESIGRDEALTRLAAVRLGSLLARAVAFERMQGAIRAGDMKKAYESFRQGGFRKEGLWSGDLRTMSRMLLEAGDVEEADRYFEAYLSTFARPLERRVRVADWDKMRHLERYQHAVPRVQGVTIDGDLSDWQDGLTLRLAGEPHVYRYDRDGPADELSANVRLGCDDETLFVAVEVADRRHEIAPADGELLAGDRLVIAIDPAGDGTRNYNEDDFEVAITRVGTETQVRFTVDRLKRDVSRIEAATQHVDGRTVYEAAVPLAMLEWNDQPARWIGFNLLISDVDDGRRVGWIDWTPGIGEEKFPRLFSKLGLEP